MVATLKWHCRNLLYVKGYKTPTTKNGYEFTQCDCPFAVSAVVAEDAPGVRDLGGDLVAAETFNLNETGDVFEHIHGKMELEFKFPQKGCYFTKRETNVLKAMKQMKEMVDAKVYVGCKFTWKTVRLPEERAIQLLRALRFREGVNTFVGLTQEDTCLVKPNQEKALKRKR